MNTIGNRKYMTPRWAQCPRSQQPAQIDVPKRGRSAGCSSASGQGCRPSKPFAWPSVRDWCTVVRGRTGCESEPQNCQSRWGLKGCRIATTHVTDDTGGATGKYFPLEKHPILSAIHRGIQGFIFGFRESENRTLQLIRLNCCWCVHAERVNWSTQVLDCCSLQTPPGFNKAA